MSGSGTRISPWNSLVDGRLTFDLTTQDLVLDQLTKENARLRKELAEGGGGTKEEIEALEKEIQDLRNRNNSLIVQLTLSEQSNQTLTTENKSLSEANEKLEEDNKILRSFISDGGKTVIELYNTALQEIEQLNNNVTQQQETIEQLNKDIESWKSTTGYVNIASIYTAMESIKSVTGDTPGTNNLNSYITSIVNWGTGINSAYSSSLVNKASGTKITDVVNAVLSTIGDSTSSATLDILNERVQAYVDNQAKYEAELDAVYSIIGQKDVQGLLDSYKDDLETNTGTKSDYTTFVGFENDYVKALQAYSQLISYAKAAITILDGTDADATAIQTKAGEVLRSFQTSLSPWSITSTNINDLIVPIVNELNKGSSSETTVTALQNTIIDYYQITHDSTANSYDSSMDEKIKDLLKKVRDDIRLNFVSKYNSEELPSKVSADDVINYYFKTSGEDLSSVFLRTRDKCQDYYKDDLDAANESLKKEKDDHQDDLNTIYEKCSGDDKDNATLFEITTSISDLVTIVKTAIETADDQDKIWEGTTVPTTTNLVDCGAAVTLMRTNYHNKVDTYDSSESTLKDIVNDSITVVGATDKDHLVSTLKQIRKDLNGLYNGSTEGSEGFTSINDVTTSMSTSIDDIKDLVGGLTVKKNLESIIDNLTNLLGKDEGDLDKPSVNKTLNKLKSLYDSNPHTSFEPLLTKMSETISIMKTTIGSVGESRIVDINDSLPGILNSLNTLAQLPTEQEQAKTKITDAVTAVDSRLTTLGNELTTAKSDAKTAKDNYDETKAQYDELVAVTGNYTVVQKCLTTLYSLYDKSMVVTWPTTENPNASYTLSDIESKFNIDLPNLWTLTDATKQETEETKQDLVTLINNLTKLVGSDNSLDDLLGNIETFYDTSSLKAPTLTNAITNITLPCKAINALCNSESIGTSSTNLLSVQANLITMLTTTEQTTYSTIPDRVTHIKETVDGAVSTILASIKEKTGDETSTTINAAVTNIESTGDYREDLQDIAGLPDVTDIGDLIITIGSAVIDIVKAVTGEEHGYSGGMNISGLAENVTSAASKLESVTGFNYIYKGETNGSAYVINWAFDATNKSGIQTYYADCDSISDLTDALAQTRGDLQAIYDGTDTSTLTINTLINEIKTIIGDTVNDSLSNILHDLNEKITRPESTLRGAVNQVGSGQTDDDRKRLNKLIDGQEGTYTTMEAAIDEADRLIGQIQGKVYAPNKTLTSINDVAGSTGITGTQIATIYGCLISGNTWDITYNGATRTINGANRNTEILIEDIKAIAIYIANIVEPNMNGNFQTIYDEIKYLLRDSKGLAHMMGCKSLKIPVAIEESTLFTLTECVTEIIGESDLGSLRDQLYMAVNRTTSPDGAKSTNITELMLNVYGTYIEQAILTYLNNLSGDEAGSILDSIKNIYGHAKNINRLVYGQNESSEELTVEKSMKDVETDLGTYINNIFANGGWTDNHDVAMIDTNIQSLHDDLSNVVYGDTLHTIKESMTQINVIGLSSLNDNLAKLQALYGSTGTDAAKYTYTVGDNTYTLTWPTSTTNGSSDNPEIPDNPEAVSDLTKVVNQIVEDVKLINDALTSDNQTKLSTAAANILTYRDQLAYLLESDSALTAPPYPMSAKTISGSAEQVRIDTSTIWTTIGTVGEYKACLDGAAGYLPDLRNSMATIVDGSDGSNLVSILEVLSGIEVTLDGLAGKDNIYDDVGVISGEWDTLKVIIGDKSLSSTLQSSLNDMIKQIDGTTADTTVSAVKTALDTAWGKYKGLVGGDDDGYLYKSEPSDETKDFYLLIQTKMTDESEAVNMLKDLIGGDSSWNPTTIDALHKQLIAEVNGLSLCIVGDHLYDDDGNQQTDRVHNGYKSVYEAWQGLKSIVGDGDKDEDNLTKERSKLTGILINATGTTSMSELIVQCQNDVNTIYKQYYQNDDDDEDKTMKNIYDDLGTFIENMKPLINIDSTKIKDINTCYTQLKSDLSMIYTGQTSNPASTLDIKNTFDAITTAITAQTDGTYASELARYQTLVGTE